MEVTSIVNRGEIYFAELPNSLGSVQSGARPVLVVQNNVGSRNAPTTIIVPLTTNTTRRTMPTHVFVNQGEGGLSKDSVVLCEQVRVISKLNLVRKIGTVSRETMIQVGRGMAIALGIY